MTTSTNSTRILLIDDDVDALRILKRIFEEEHYKVLTAETAQQALVSVNINQPTIALLDLGLPDSDGVELLENLLNSGVDHVIVVTGNSSAETTRQCLRKGAFDFILKPVSRYDLLQAVRRATSSYQVRKVDTQEYPLVPTPGFGALETPSRASQSVFDSIKRMSQASNAHALIIGAAGMFKRDIAISLHHQCRKSGQALLIHCVLENDDHAASRFMGHTTMAGQKTHDGYLDRASHGTLILDDLSLLPLSAQEMVVAHIKHTQSFHQRDTKPADQSYCNIVGILKEPLDEALSTGRLLPELHTALAANLIRVPSLAERPEDVEVYAQHAVLQLNTLLNSEKALSKEFTDFLTAQPWEGNLIELKNRLLTVYRATENGEELIYDPLLWPSAKNDATRPKHMPGIAPMVGMSLAEAELRLIKATLTSVNNNKTKASDILGISVKTLYNRLNS